MKFFRASSMLIVLLLGACSTTPKKLAPQASAVTNVAGTWTIAIQTPMGPRNSVLVLEQNDSQLNGVMRSPRGEADVSGVIRGNEIAFTMKIDTQGMNMTVDYAGTVENDTMKGKVVLGQFGEGNWTGKRQP